MSIIDLSDKQSALLRKVVFDAWQHAESEYLSWTDDGPTMERLGMSHEQFCSHRNDLARKTQDMASLYEVVRSCCTPVLNLGL